MPVFRSALALLLLATSGCAFRSQVSGMAVEYNEFVAEATNRQTVVNILRARSREPLHFTSFAKVLGTARVEGTAGLDLTANGNGGEQLPGGGGFATSKRTLGATNLTPRLGVRINSGTDFEIGVNATDDFWKGITTPVAPATIVHLLRQGWERDLISYLFVHKIDFAGRITDPKGQTVATLPLGALRNAPDYEATVEPFTNLIRCRTLYYSLAEAAEGSEFTITFAENMEVSAPIRREACARFEKGLRDQFQQALSSQGVTLPPLAPDGTTDAPSATGAPGTDPFRGRSHHGAGAPPGPGVTSPNGAGFTATDYFRGLVPAGYKTELLVDVSLRSVEGMINYLGEYVRTVNERPLAYGRCEDGQFRQCIPLIVIKPAEEAGNAEPFITVDYKGKSYIVPLSGEDIRSGAGFSSQVIGLVQTMLNLHRSSKDLPSTPLVRVIN
ncbi:hypothetical protein [Sphingomonas sp.]|jgi:hypothetical protein|uniref:hypothetical protein n=1 Tax=Sphingomonas sp. TaxID=28214 RepID=UPI002DF1D380|nr:hypothetical protein [Sphingomonas sp.]